MPSAPLTSALAAKPRTTTVSGLTPAGARSAAASSSAPASRWAQLRVRDPDDRRHHREVERDGGLERCAMLVGRLERELGLGRAVVGDPDAADLELGVRGRDRDGARRAVQQAQAEHLVRAVVAGPPVGAHDDQVGVLLSGNGDEAALGRARRRPRASRQRSRRRRAALELRRLGVRPEAPGPTTRASTSRAPSAASRSASRSAASAAGVPSWPTTIDRMRARDP